MAIAKFFTRRPANGVLRAAIFTPLSLSVFCLSAILIGLVLDSIIGNYMFARSGAAIVGLVALFFALDERYSPEYLQELEKRVAREMEQAFSSFSGEEIDELGGERIVRGKVAHARYDWLAEQDATLKMRKWEAIWLFFGTLIWGFGDILANVLLHCRGALAC